MANQIPHGEGILVKCFLRFAFFHGEGIVQIERVLSTKKVWRVPHHKGRAVPCPPLESLMNCAAFEFQNLFRHEANPSFAVAVDGVFVALGFQNCGGRGTRAFDQAAIFVLAVDHSNRAILFDELKGEKLALCFGDERVDLFGDFFLVLHGFAFVFCFLDAMVDYINGDKGGGNDDEGGGADEE